MDWSLHSDCRCGVTFQEALRICLVLVESRIFPFNHSSKLFERALYAVECLSERMTSSSWSVVSIPFHPASSQLFISHCDVVRRHTFPCKPRSLSPAHRNSRCFFRSKSAARPPLVADLGMSLPPLSPSHHRRLVGRRLSPHVAGRARDPLLLSAISLSRPAFRHCPLARTGARCFSASSPLYRETTAVFSFRCPLEVRA